MTIEAVLFDLDGTLVDSNDMHVMAWREAFARSGFEIDPQTIHGQIGKGSDMLVPSLIPDADEAIRKTLAHDHGEIFQTRFLDQVRPFPGAHGLLAHVHSSGQRVVLASSASQVELDHYLDLLQARDLVSGKTSGDDVENTKPAPDIFAVALERLAPLSPRQVIAVGDTPYDVEAAGRCGIATVALRSGRFPNDVLWAAGAVALYDDVAALLDGYAESPLAG